MEEKSAATGGTEPVMGGEEISSPPTEKTPAPVETQPTPATETPRFEAPPMDMRIEHARLLGEQEKTASERAKLIAQQQVAEISELDGEIKSLDDILDMPEYDGFYALVKKGVSLVDAYKLTRYDRLVKRAADAAARQTMRSLGSRSHLTALAGQPGAGEYVSVPADIAAEYRLAKPGITDEEIRRKYRKYQKYKRQ